MTRVLPWTVMVVLLAATPLAAQTDAPVTPPPHLSVLEGAADLERGQDREAAIPNTPLALGDRLRTHSGRAEVLLGDGSALHLDESTAIDLNGDTVVRLLEGRLIVFGERSAVGLLQVDAAPGSVRLQSSGEVRLALVDADGVLALEVGVVRGLVDVETERGRTSLRAGQHVLVREGEAPTYPAPFNSARVDAFVAWSQQLMDARRGTASGQYLPTDVRAYGPTFDQYGSWNYDASYGYVWYPRVAVGWRPYHHGRWRHYPRFGWSFIGHDPWGWATYHYGRWGISSAGAWFWIPTRRWGAAWVHWAVAPGYVGWCPLGFDNRPVIGFFGRGVRHARHDRWRAWSVVPVASFRGGHRIHRVNFDPRRVVTARGPQFILQPTPPSVAVPRGSVVPREYRTAGSSIAPRAGHSRRGPAASVDSTPRRAGRIPQSTGTPAGSVQSATGSVRSAPSRGGSDSPAYAVPRGSAPGVVYYRGTRRSDRDDARGDRDDNRGGAEPYERAGVAVPRGLPGTSSAPAPESGGRVRSPYGEYQSPYAVRRGRGTQEAPATEGAAAPPPSRRGDAPAYAPRYAPRQTAPPAQAAPPASAPPPSRAVPRSGPPPSSAPSPRSSAPRYAPPRQSAPPPSQAAPPPSRSGGEGARSRGDGGGRSQGTAVPRGGRSRR